MTFEHLADDHVARDATIAINTYTTVLRRPQVSHEVFATYWRDVHGPLCSRVPGLAWYVQYHFDREQDAHLWPVQEGIVPFPDYVLDGGVEIGFADAADQATFSEASSILFSDEQNMFAATVAYTYVRDKELTMAGLRGSRPAQLIERLGATNQTGDDVRQLLMTGTVN